MAEVRTDDFLIDVARGNVNGASIIHKFGANAAIGTTIKPVTTSGTYQTPITSESLEILSDNALDAAAGSGARSVEVTGIDSNWDILKETVTLNGVTPVALSNTFRRVFRMRVKTSGTYATSIAGSHEGIITLRGAGAGVTWALIGFNEGFPLGSSEISVYTIPRGYEGIILHRELDVEAAKLCNILFFIRAEADLVAGGDYKPMVVTALRRDVTGLHLDGSPSGSSELMVGPCDVGFMAVTTSGTAKVNCAFKLLLLKQKL